MRRSRRLEFAADRLRTLLPRVRDQYRKVAAAEDLKEWYAKQDKLKVGCDALAVELSEVYPGFEAAIVDLFTRVANHNRSVHELHLSRPAGAKGQLLDPELVARGIETSHAIRRPSRANCKFPIGNTPVSWRFR